MPKRKYPNPRYEFPVLAHVECPACGKIGAWVSATGQHAALYISCRACGGRMIKAPFVCRYLLQLQSNQIEFQNGWSWQHLRDVSEQYEHSHKRKAAQFVDDATHSTQASARAKGVCRCPACKKNICEIRETGSTGSPFLHCPGCGGEIMGAKATLLYLVRQREVEFFGGYKKKIDGLVARLLL